MANLGNVAIKPKGEWVIGVTYKPLNAVTHNGNLYLALQENAVEPENDGVNWWLILEGVPIATTDIVGKSKPDGETITIDEDGTLHGASQVPEGVTYIDNSQEETLPDRLLINADLLDGNSSDYYANIETVTKIQGDIDTLEENITQISNSNLLINPNFIISDYKTLSLIGAGKQDYICDNWFYYWVNNEGSCEYNNGVITLYYGRIGQKIELPAGRYTVTANILESDSTIAVYVNGYGYADHQIGHFESSITGLASFTFEVHEFNEIFFQAIAKSENGVKIDWIKLETGSIATKYTIPNSEIELLKCKGYTKASNPNLLINPDFKINQRGKTEYIGHNIYTVDRWILWNGILTLQEDGVTIIRDSPSSSYYEFRQYIEIDSNYILGKNLVGSLCIDGIVYLGVYNIPLSLNENFVKDIELFTDFNLRIEIQKTNKNILIFQIYNYGEQAHTIKWAKLELGSVATPFVPPDKATELVKCQRYYQRIGVPSGNFHAIILNMDTYATIAQYLIFYYNLSIPMRTVPTAKLYGTPNNDSGYSIAYMDGNSVDTSFQWSYEVNTTVSDKFRIIVRNTSTNKFDTNIFTTKHLVFYTNSGVELDAEIH